MTVLYEDNHIIIVNKAAGEIVQGDKTGDRTLADDVKAYIKEKYAKPGDVFLGVTHRLDRPVSGVVVFARTSKALARMNDLFRTGGVRKTYHAIVGIREEVKMCSCEDVKRTDAIRKEQGRSRFTSSQLHNFTSQELYTLEGWLTRNEQQNKAYCHAHEVRGSKHAVLDYRVLSRGDRYALLEVHLHTGRHHQIRCQLAAAGMPIKGDLKYGAPRSNPDGSICLHARHIEFEHPVSHKLISVEAPYPAFALWKQLSANILMNN